MADGGSPAQLMTSLDATAGHDLDRLAQVLAASKEFRVLRRLQRRDRYHSTDGAATRLALFVDVETTGLACDRDRVIELAAVPFDYGLVTAEIYTVHEPVTYLEDPEKAIAPEITALTGITTAMVRGHRIDDAVINALVSSASLVIAHNAPILPGMLGATPHVPVYYAHNDLPRIDDLARLGQRFNDHAVRIRQQFRVAVRVARSFRLGFGRAKLRSGRICGGLGLVVGRCRDGAGTA